MEILNKRTGWMAWRGLLLFLTMLCVLCGCGKQMVPLPNPCEKGFTAELIWERAGVTLRATMVAKAEGESGTRDLSLSFRAPEELGGLCVTRQGGRIQMERDGVVWSDIPAEGFLQVADALFVTDGMKDLCNVENNGEVLRLTEGLWQGSRLQCYRTVSDGIPRALQWGETYIRVLRFETTD